MDGDRGGEGNFKFEIGSAGRGAEERGEEEGEAVVACYRSPTARKAVSREEGGRSQFEKLVLQKKELRLPFYRGLVLVTFKNLLTNVFLKLQMCS